MLSAANAVGAITTVAGKVEVEVVVVMAVGERAQHRREGIATTAMNRAKERSFA